MTEDGKSQCGCSESYPQLIPGRLSHWPNCPFAKNAGEFLGGLQLAMRWRDIAQGALASAADALTEAKRLFDYLHLAAAEIERLRAVLTTLQRAAVVSGNTETAHHITDVLNTTGRLKDLIDSESLSGKGL